MSAVSCVVFLAVLAAMAGTGQSTTPNKEYYDVNEAPDLFEKFMKDHNRNYKDEGDKKVHYDAFVQNLAKINELNAKDPHASFGINKFADYTDEERKNMFGYKKN